MAQRIFQENLKGIVLESITHQRRGLLFAALDEPGELDFVTRLSQSIDLKWMLVFL